MTLDFPISFFCFSGFDGEFHLGSEGVRSPILKGVLRLGIVRYRKKEKPISSFDLGWRRIWVGFNVGVSFVWKFVLFVFNASLCERRGFFNRILLLSLTLVEEMRVGK